ncbi:MAG: aminotransferase class V-fold PLP-dependent enzyme [Vicinamibacterales bacterium]
MQCTRRAFLDLLGASTAIPAVVVTHQAATAGAAAWRREFPALDQTIDGKPLAYLDSAATTLRPRAVIDAQGRFDAADNANPGAALHTLARRAAAHYGGARARVARFLNAGSPAEIVFTRGTTEAINLVAATWGAAHVARGDEIVLTVAEHYSNLLPWRAVAERAGATIRLVDVGDDGRLHPDRVAAALTPRTRLLAFSHVSNVLGLVNPAAEIAARARARGVAVLIDAAQSAPHVGLDVQALGCDFLACSSHKLLGPMGVGVLWARQATLDAMPPYHLGSNMAHEVEATSVQFEHGAMKYQAGTPDVAGAVGLAAALDVLDRFNLAAVRRHDASLVEHARRGFASVRGLRVLGALTDGVERLPVFTFTLPGVAVSRLVAALDAEGIAVRGGDMAALPLLRRFGVAETVRASCYVYTTTDEIDRMVDVLRHHARAA